MIRDGVVQTLLHEMVHQFLFEWSLPWPIRANYWHQRTKPSPPGGVRHRSGFGACLQDRPMMTAREVAFAVGALTAFMLLLLVAAKALF
jgi:hypothetical protein